MFIICMLSLGWMQSLYPLNSMPITLRDLSFSGGGGAMVSEQISLNPASIFTEKKEFAFHTQFLPTGISLLSLNAIYSKNEIIYFTSISNLHFGTLKDGRTNEAFSANDFMINGGVKMRLFQIISVGTSISYTFSLIENNIAQSILFSTGFRTEISKDKAGLGFTLRNMGSQFDNFGDITEKIPLQLQASGFMKPKYLSALIFSDIVIEENIDGYTFISGMEFYPRGGLTLRISHSGLYNNSFELNSLAFGFGFNLKNWTVDLASRNLVSAGFVNGVTVSKQF